MLHVLTGMCYPVVVRVVVASSLILGRLYCGFSDIVRAASVAQRYVVGAISVDSLNSSSVRVPPEVHFNRIISPKCGGRSRAAFL